MENSSIENSSSLLSINVLDNNLKSEKEVKLENILEEVKEYVFNKELLEGDSLLKINEFFLSLQQESSKAEGNLESLKKFIKKYIKESPKNCQTSSYKTDIAYIFFAYQKGLSVQMVDNFIESPYIKNKLLNKSSLVELFLSNTENQKENAFSFLLKNLTADNFTKDSQSRRTMIRNFAENPLYQEELKELFIGSNLIESKKKYNDFFSDFEKNYKKNRQDTLKRKDFGNDIEYVKAVINNNKLNQEIIDKTYLLGKHYNHMSGEGIIGIDSASSNMTILGKAGLIQNLDEIIKASAGCQQQDLNACVSLETFVTKESEINFTSIRKNFSPSSKDFLIIEVKQDTHNANFAEAYKLIIEQYNPSVHGVKIILKKIKKIEQKVADISLADLGEINLDNQLVAKIDIKAKISNFQAIPFINYRVAINKLPRNDNCEDVVLLFKNQNHQEPIVIIDDTATQLKEIKEIIDPPFENIKNKKVKPEIERPKNYQLTHKKLAYVIENNESEDIVDNLVKKVFGDDYSLEKLKKDIDFADKKENNAPCPQISNSNISQVQTLMLEKNARI